ncbi:MAG: pyridoxamine 5'-phosphate oxidase [Methylocystaceae bacterium]|nr:MAG: pyridoxamine 5'-phosphate oxidase [Methylocystaceae bacterium]
MNPETPDAADYRIVSIAQLEALYGRPGESSLGKETRALTPEYRRWIEASPFLAIASCGPGGLDCSPRGDPVGSLVRIVDDRTLAIPDRRGNNRIDTLRNLIVDPRVALLFFIPGVNETLRVAGRASVTAHPELIRYFSAEGKAPRTVLLVEIEAVYFQCARALIRAGLWTRGARADARAAPTAGEMLRAAIPGFDGAEYDAALPERQKATLY